MRQTNIVLTNINNIFRITLQYRCTRITILNNTSNDVYINHSSFQPMALARDYVVKAAVSGIPGNVQLPQNAYEYCFFLPTTPSLTDTTQVVTILLEGLDIETVHYKEVLLNALSPKKKSI